MLSKVTSSDLLFQRIILTVVLEIKMEHKGQKQGGQIGQYCNNPVLVETSPDLTLIRFLR